MSLGCYYCARPTPMPHTPGCPNESGRNAERDAGHKFTTVMTCDLCGRTQLDLATRQVKGEAPLLCRGLAS
jgi:hypothetical protein